MHGKVKGKLRKHKIIHRMPTTPYTSEEPQTLTEITLDTPWNVVVHNDPVNLMQYVVHVFQKVLAMNVEDATARMMEVHEKGRSIVWSGAREQAEYYMYQLQKWRLNATLEQANG